MFLELSLCTKLVIDVKSFDSHSNSARHGLFCYVPHFTDDKEKSAQGYPLAREESAVHTPAAWTHL